MTKKTKKKISLLLVEDHKIVRKGLRALLELEGDMEVLGEAENGLEAIKLTKRLQPAVVIMDIALPKLNGIESARNILVEQPNTKILMLSAHGDDGYLERVSSIGVSGYLIKQCSPHFLIQAVREVAKGKMFFSPAVQNRISVLGKRQNVARSLSVPFLSRREYQVVQMIAEGKANKQIGADLGISVKTVEKHRQNLMKKLSIHDTAGLTRYAIAEGIIESSRQSTIIQK